VLKNALLPGDSTKRFADFLKERPPIHLPYPTASPAPVFRSTISLDKQKQPPILSSHQKQYLIKQISESKKVRNIDSSYMKTLDKRPVRIRKPLWPPKIAFAAYGSYIPLLKQ
jgi:hypothetical protein